MRGPKYVVKKGKTPVLAADESRELLDSIPVVKKTKLPHGTETEEPDLIGLRDRALIGSVVYTFACVNAVLQMKVKDYFVQGRRGWVRLHERGGKEHAAPCHHNLDSTSMNTSRRPVSPKTRKGRCFAPPAGKRGRHKRCGNRTLTG